MHIHTVHVFKMTHSEHFSLLASTKQMVISEVMEDFFQRCGILWSHSYTSNLMNFVCVHEFNSNVTDVHVRTVDREKISCF